MKFMFLLCEKGKYRELSYSSCVAEKIAEKVRMLGHDVILVRRPTPEVANEAIKNYKPDVVWWVGHGDIDKTTLENIELWISTDYNVQILDNVIACALSCFTGKYLGRYLVENYNCLAYLGYTTEFWFIWCNEAKYDNCACTGKNPFGIDEDLWYKLVICNHEANLYFVLGLAKRMSVRRAKEYSLERFKFWIDYFENVEPKDKEENAVIRTCIWCLNNNMKATVLYSKIPELPEAPKVDEIKMMSVPMLFLALGSLFSYFACKGGEKVAD